MSPAMRRAAIIVMALSMAVWTANSVLREGHWGPPVLALAGVGVLFACAALLASLNRGGRPERSSGLVAWFDGCPGWFEGVLLGLTVVALATGLYRLWESLDEAAVPGAYELAFDPLVLFMMGCLTLLHLVQMRPSGLRRGDS